MDIDRAGLEDRLAVLEHLITTHDERVAEHQELSLLRLLLHARDEGMITISAEGECYPLACPSIP